MSVLKRMREVHRTTIFSSFCSKVECSISALSTHPMHRICSFINALQPISVISSYFSTLLTDINEIIEYIVDCRVTTLLFFHFTQVTISLIVNQAESHRVARPNGTTILILHIFHQFQGFKKVIKVNMISIIFKSPSRRHIWSLLAPCISPCFHFSQVLGHNGLWISCSKNRESVDLVGYINVSSFFWQNRIIIHITFRRKKTKLIDIHDWWGEGVTKLNFWCPIIIIIVGY